MAQLLLDPIDSRRRLLHAEISFSEQEEFFALTQDVAMIISRRAAVQETLRKAFLQSFGNEFSDAVVAALRDRRRGAIRLSIAPEFADVERASRFGAALATICGSPYSPMNSGTLTATNLMEHVETSVPGIRSPYRADPLHTDTHGFDELHEDYLVVMCQTKFCADGGASRLLHLDDWEDLCDFARSPAAALPVRYVFSAKGALAPAEFQKLHSHDGLDIRHRPLFWQADGGTCINLTRGYMYPDSIEQTELLSAISLSLTESTRCVEFVLEAGDMYLVNNRFWLHGRAPLAVHPKLCRLLLQFRGTF